MPWHSLLQGANSPDDIVRIAQDFVAQLGASEVEYLPRECRPPQLATPEDVRRYALQLVQHHAHGDNSRSILRVSEVISAAAIRLAELQRQAPRGD